MQITKRPMMVKKKPSVCAYDRVSTDKLDQANSLSAQIDYWNRRFTDNPDIDYVGLFPDDGISGKYMKNRKGLNDLIALARNGDIDAIYEVYIKVRHELYGDNYNNKRTTGYGRVASLAEEESRSMSNNIRWSVRKKFEQGKVIMNTAKFLGYKHEKNSDVLEIVPEDAITVRRIYKDFVQGLSLKEIADGLERDKIPSPTMQEKWHVSTIRSILTNEKYMGDCHLQKTYLADFLSPRRVENVGQADSWYVEDSHAAIVTKEQFALVQEEFKKRKSLRASTETGNGKLSGKYAFSGMIVCGECGEMYRRHQQYNRYKVYPTWACKIHENTGARHCTAKPIKEKAIEDAVVRAINKLLDNKEQFLAELKATVLEVMLDDTNNPTFR